MDVDWKNDFVHKRHRDGPEAIIQSKIVAKLTLLGWKVVILHGNLFQKGMPDLFCCHSRYGIRLVEVKNPENYNFTAAQLDEFPKLSANGAKIWVLTSDSDYEIGKLFGPENWFWYLK